MPVGMAAIAEQQYAKDARTDDGPSDDPEDVVPIWYNDPVEDCKCAIKNKGCEDGDSNLVQGVVKIVLLKIRFEMIMRTSEGERHPVELHS